MELAAGRQGQDPLDVLCLLRKPGATPDETDRRLSQLTAAVKGLPEVAHLLSRGLDGEGRLLVRLAAQTSYAAGQGVVEVLRVAAKPGTGELTCALVPQAARSRQVWQLLDPAGDASASKRLAAMGQQALGELPCITRSEVVNSLEDVVALELQTKTIADAHVDLPSIIQALTSQTTIDTNWSEWLAATTVQPAGGRPKVPLANLIAVTTGQSRGLRTGRNGKVVVPALTLTGGLRCDPADLGIKAATWQRKHMRLEGPADVWASVATEAATRVYLRTKRDQVAESEENFAERLAKIRKSPTSLGAVALRGLDGIPMQLQPDAAQGGAWTLWLTDSEGEALSTLSNFRTEMEAAGWQIAPLSPSADVALAWLLDDPASAGVLVSDVTVDTIHQAAQAVGSGVLKMYGLEKVMRGPVRLASHLTASVWLSETMALEDRTAAWLQDLLAGGHNLHWAPGSTDRLARRVVIKLPAGDRAQFHGILPVAQAKSDGQPMPTLGQFRRTPSPLPVDERLRWNQRPVGWVRVSSFNSPAESLGVAFEEAIAPQTSSYPTVKWWPLTFPQQPGR